MKNIFITVAFLISNFLVMPTSLANDGADIKLRGELFSASATITVGQSSAVLTQVPEGKKLIVTQYCRGGFMGGIDLVGSVLGRVPAEFSSACTTYIPGVLFTGGQSISCVFIFGPAFEDIACLINGVIQ